MTESEKPTYLLGSRAVSRRPRAPYDRLVCEFLAQLSSELRSSKEAAGYADIMTFAFWCRGSSIARRKAEFEDGRARLGLGLVFHVTPANVPVNFAFSFVFGLLSGNANIVRVPSKPFSQTAIVCAAVERLFEREEYSEIRDMTAFVRYGWDDEVSGAFSAECNARVVWGGDAAIRHLRKLPIRERCVEITFADRYSFCVMDAPSVVAAADAQLERLATSFYNDTYLMDQEACSSPHLIIWQGNRKEEAKEKFWSAVQRVVAERYELAAVDAVEKYTRLCRSVLGMDNIRSIRRHGNDIYRISVDSLPANMDTLRGRCGYFYEHDADDLQSIAHVINDRYQTLSYFGPDRSALLDFVLRNRLQGIDRIVPVGRALEIDVIWDGYDIVRSLSRIVHV